MVIGIVALASCSSSGKTAVSSSTTPASGTTATTTPARVTTTTAGGTTATTAPPGTATTTPATVAPGTSAKALSATFVSSAQGFSLEQTGTIVATSDGGHSWHRVGIIATHGPDEVIRYIDPTDGFAFERTAGPLMITHDTGATWTQVSTPFTTVADLAIGHGMIYVISVNQGATVTFQIWSTPVAHLVWKRDPLTLPVGAGPDPVEEIVLNASHGWILDQNRTVIAGAELQANGTWAKWNPPCLNVFGPAYLSASTATDLVATCDEGVWGGNLGKITPTVSFSHDGGATFTRHLAPVFGPVLSPSAQTAAIDGANTIQLTTNGGTSFAVAASIGASDTSDWGFTSTTQGFVITGGEMLMTYDAGATWTPASLP